MRLRQVRRERELTLDDVAKRVHLHRTTIQKLERGKTQPSLDAARRFAEFFGLPIDELFSYVELPQ